MTVATIPSTRAHDTAVRALPPQLAQELQELLGQKFTALLAGVRDPKAVGHWARGEHKPGPAPRERLRCAFQVVCLLREAGESRETIQAWFTGTNPHLDYRSPILLIAEDKCTAVLQAAQAFLSEA